MTFARSFPFTLQFIVQSVIGATRSTAVSVDEQLKPNALVLKHVVMRVLLLIVAGITDEEFRTSMACPASTFDFRDATSTTAVAFVYEVRVLEIRHL
jgi:hypothetical protein